MDDGREKEYSQSSSLPSFFSVLSSLALTRTLLLCPPLFFLFRPLAESLLRSMLSTHIYTHTRMHREKTEKRRMQIHFDICAQSTRSTWYIDTFQLSSTYCTLQVAWAWAWAWDSMGRIHPIHAPPPQCPLAMQSLKTSSQRYNKTHTTNTPQRLYYFSQCFAY